MVTFERMTVAEFDQAHARTRDALDNLIKHLVSVGEHCTCGEPIDSKSHMTVTADHFARQYSITGLSWLLTEALARLVVAQGAK